MEHKTLAGYSAIFTAGSVSTGTLRPEDLIPAFICEIDALVEAMTFLDGADERVYVQAIGKIQDKLGAIEARGIAGDESDCWTLDELGDLLDFIAPDGLHFSSHEGDGADFGWWTNDDDD